MIHFTSNSVKDIIVNEDDTWDIMFYLIKPFMEMAGLDDRDDNIKNPFYAGPLTSDEDGYVGLAGLLVAAVFRGNHCIAWSFQFATHTEKILWRVLSLTIACAPGLACNRHPGAKVAEGGQLLLTVSVRWCTISPSVNDWRQMLSPVSVSHP